MKTTRTITLAMALIMPLALLAQHSYTADEVSKMAIEHNISVRTADNQISQASETRKDTYNAFLPKVSASAIGFAADKHLLDLNLGLASYSALKNGVTAGVSVMQPIYAGGRISNGYKLSKYGEDAARIQKDISIRQVAYNAQRYFWQVVDCKEAIRTLDVSDSLLSKLHIDVSSAIKAGLKNRNDLLKVELEQNKNESAHIKLNNALKQSLLLLAQYIGKPQTLIDISSPIEIGKLPNLYVMEVSPSDKVEQRPEYKLLEKNVDISHTNLNIEKGKSLPTLGIGASYSYDNFFDKNNLSGVVFVTLSVPISNLWEGGHKEKKASLQLQNTVEALQDNRELLAIEIQKAHDDVIESWQQIKVSIKSITQAEENLRLNTNTYRAGTTTMSDILDAQAALQNAKNEYIQAYAAYQLCIVDYKNKTE